MAIGWLLMLLLPLLALLCGGDKKSTVKVIHARPPPRSEGAEGAGKAAEGEAATGDLEVDAFVSEGREGGVEGEAKVRRLRQPRPTVAPADPRGRRRDGPAIA